jgi:SAM-dependent methyltransferase
MRACHLCGGSDLLTLIEFGSYPVSKHYLTDRNAEPPTWPVNLYFCESCGLTQLQDSCPPEVLYENYVTLSSWKPQPHAAAEIEKIRALDGLTPDAKIIEIGCNDGGFLELLAAAGYRNLLGIEPSKDAYDGAVAKGLNVVREFLTPALAQRLVERHGTFDLFVSRQNLEHMADVAGVIECLRTLLRPGGYALIELPNFGCNLTWRDYSLWEEHVNQFTEETLRYFLALAGIEPVHEEKILFSGEGLVVIGRRTSAVTPSLAHVPELRRRNLQYAHDWPAFREELGEYLAGLRRAGRRIAVYGAGSRAFCLLNFAGLAAHIDVIVDDQPEKQNKFMPGGRIPIVTSDALYSRGIDVCLLTVNTENEEKVMAKHDRWARQGGQFWSVFPPSARLPPIWSAARV